MDSVRHIFGVICVSILPSGLLFWFLIHPWAHRWRRLGPARTYLIVLTVVIAVGAVLYRFRRPLLGEDLGTSWILIGIAGVFYAITMWFEFQYWRHLRIATLIGVTELSRTGNETGKLLREGIYARLRHPRYASAGLGLIGNVLLINYRGLYVLSLLVIPTGLCSWRWRNANSLTALAMRTGSINGRSHNSYPGCEGRVKNNSRWVRLTKAEAEFEFRLARRTNDVSLRSRDLLGAVGDRPPTC